MKKFYSLLLSMLLLVVGGVEVKAQTTLVYSWDFTDVYSEIKVNGTTDYETLYKELSIKGYTSISNGLLTIPSRTNNSDPISGVKIPATSGQIVKVTGYAPSTNDTFTWIGAELIEGMFGNGAANSSVVVGVGIKGEKSSEDAIDNSVAIENGRIQDPGSRNLCITKIEVYDTDNDFRFIKPDSESDDYTIYNKGYVIKNGADPLDVRLPDKYLTGSTSVTKPLEQGMYKKWDGVDASAKIMKETPTFNAYRFGEGDGIANGYKTYYGNSSVPKDEYADISKADGIRISGTPGMGFRVTLNRQENKDDNSTDILIADNLDSNGTFDVYFNNEKYGLTSYEYVHLNAIKTAWDATGTISGVELITTSKVKYSCECKGDITASIDGNGKIYDINGIYDDVKNTTVKGGAIVVKASYTDPVSDIVNTAEYVITVPYETKEWDFTNTETKENLYLNTANIADWGLTWKVRIYKRDNDGKVVSMDQLSAPVLSNTAAVSGDNARFIDATAGLIFVADSYRFGTNTTAEPGGYDDSSDKRMAAVASYNSANNVPKDVMNQSVTMQVGSKLIIPNLKEGQHVRLRWNRHSPGNGDLMKAYNVRDLAMTDMAEKRFYIGAGPVNTTRGHQEFIVKEDGDVTFELVDVQGWANIINIKVGEVGENLETHLKPHYLTDGFDAAVDKDENKVTFDMTPDITIPDREVDHTNEKEDNDGPFVRRDVYTYLRKSDKDKWAIMTKLSLFKEETRAQDGNQTDKYYILPNSYTGTLNGDNCKIGDIFYEIAYNSKNEKQLRPRMPLMVKPGNHGSFTLVLESRQDGNTENCDGNFLLDSIHIKVNVYEYDYNVKPYPYTWAMEHFTEDTGNNTRIEIEQDKSSGNGYWAADNVFKIGNPDNMIAWKKRTNTQFQGEVTYKMKSGEKMVSGQTIPVRNDKNKNEAVATVTFGERYIDDNGNKIGEVFNVAEKHSGVEGYDAYTPGNNVNGNVQGGTFYTIIPKYDGTITIAVCLNGTKEDGTTIPFYIEENGIPLTEYNGITKNDKYYGTFSFAVQEGQHYKFYAKGSKLGFYGFNYTYNQTGDIYIPELDGLGIMPAEYWNEEDKDLQLVTQQQGLIFGDRVYQLKVPEVQTGQTLYLAVIPAENKTARVAVGSSENTISAVGYKGYVFDDDYYKGNSAYVPIDLDIYKVEGKGEDIDLYLSNLTLHKMAVSVDSKDVYCDTGFATEAREYPLDMTLARLFLGKEQKAYKVTGVDKSTEHVTMEDVKFIPMTIDGSTSENNGIVVKGEFTGLNAGNATTQWPLFTTDINRATPDENFVPSDMRNNLLIGVVANANVEKNVEHSETVEETTYYNYMLANQGYNIQYDDEEHAKDSTKPGTYDGTITNGVGFYLVLKTETEINGTKYKGGKPKDHSAYLKLGEWLAKKNPLTENSSRRRANANEAGIHQVFFIDVDNLETDIKDILIDDASQATGNAANLLENGVFYTLQGIPVKNPTKGIYIFNGKKVYVK